MAEGYIDIRLKVTLETEEYGEGYSYTYIESMSAKVKKSKGVPEDALYSLYESFGQSDRWQEWLQSEIPEAIREHSEESDEPTETSLNLPAFTADRGGVQYGKN